VTRLLRLTITIEHVTAYSQSLATPEYKLLMAELADSSNEVFQRLP